MSAQTVDTLELTIPKRVQPTCLQDAFRRILFNAWATVVISGDK